MSVAHKHWTIGVHFRFGSWQNWTNLDIQRQGIESSRLCLIEYYDLQENALRFFHALKANSSKLFEFWSLVCHCREIWNWKENSCLQQSSITPSSKSVWDNSLPGWLRGTNSTIWSRIFFLMLRKRRPEVIHPIADFLFFSCVRKAFRIRNGWIPRVRSRMFVLHFIIPWSQL